MLKFKGAFEICEECDKKGGSKSLLGDQGVLVFDRHPEPFEKIGEEYKVEGYLAGTEHFYVKEIEIYEVVFKR